MTRILFVSYSGRLGGAERVLLDCATEIGGSAVLACPPGALGDQAALRGLVVVELPDRPLALRRGSGARLRGALALAAHGAELRTLSRDLEPGLVVAWGMRSALAGLVLRGGQRWAFDHHDFLPGPLIARGVRAAAGRAALVTVPSRAVAQDLDPGGGLGSRLVVISPGVDTEGFAGIGEAGDAPAVVVVGALAGWKRPDLALEICALARRALPALTVRLVGAPPTDDPGLLADLAHRAAAPDLAGAAELAGPMPDVREELARAACLLHCAPREPFGLAVLEAMAAARPVVVPDTAGPSEIVDADCAETYSAGDAREGAAALVRLLSNPERARAVGAAGRRRARARFELARATAAFGEALVPLAAEREAAPAASSSPAGIDVVSVTHNSAAVLPTLIASLARELPSARLIVVDCHSSDATLELARRAPGVEVLALEANLGFGRACNRGLEAVSAPVTVLLNPDVALLDASLATLAAEVLRPDRPERILAPLVLGPDGRRQQTVHPEPGGAAELIRAVIPAAALPGRLGVELAPWRSRRPRRLGWAAGAALVARTETLRGLGGFDEEIFMYGEDMELGLRAGAAGVASWFWPSARVLHRGAHATTPAFGGEPFVRLARARHYAVARSRGVSRARRDAAVQAVTFASRWLAKGILGRPAVRERRQLAALGSLLGASRDSPL